MADGRRHKANATRAHLLDVAKHLGISGRWSMKKADLVTAIEKANRQATTKAVRAAHCVDCVRGRLTRRRVGASSPVGAPPCR